MSRTTVMQMREDFTEEKTGLRAKILVCSLSLLGIGVINSMWTHLDYHTWYQALTKPVFSPSPRWIVGLLWTIMYITVGISVGMIWQLAVKSTNRVIRKRAQVGLLIFLVQVLVNMCVPYFFFDLNNLHMVLAGVSVNLVLAAAMAISYYPIHRRAAYILIPYLIWLLYATILDGALVILN